MDKWTLSSDLESCKTRLEFGAELMEKLLSGDKSVREEAKLFVEQNKPTHQVEAILKDGDMERIYREVLSYGETLYRECYPECYPKNPKDLTDQELNEWVKKTIFASHWDPSNPKYAVSITFVREPDFCNNLNHAHLMEEKIREMGVEVVDHYLKMLAFLVSKENHGFFDRFMQIHASPQQRVEAAYLALNKND